MKWSDWLGPDFATPGERCALRNDDPRQALEMRIRIPVLAPRAMVTLVVPPGGTVSVNGIPAEAGVSVHAAPIAGEVPGAGDDTVGLAVSDNGLEVVVVRRPTCL
jgi:hypothetical protein